MTGEEYDTLLASIDILTDEEKEWIKGHPIIKATSKIDAAPNEFIRAGDPVGFSVDYLNLVAKNVGLKIEYVHGFSWDELLTKLKSREIDISHNIFYNEARAEYLNFTEPYLNLEGAIFSQTGSQKINTLDDLTGKSIGVVKGWALNNSYKQTYPNLNFVEIDSTLNAILKLSSGDLDLFFGTLFIGKTLIAKYYVPNIEVVGKTDFLEISSNEGSRIAVRNDWPELQTIFEKGMNAITEQQYRELNEKWLMPEKFDDEFVLTTEEINWLSQNPIIKVAIDPFLLPVEFIGEDGKISGIAGAYLDVISDKLKVQFEWIENETFDDGLKKLQNKEADIFSAISPSEERSEYLTFTDTYMDLNLIIFGRVGEVIFGDLEGLSGHILATAKGFVFNEILVRDYPNIEIMETSSKAEALRLVSEGIADAHIGSVLLTSHTLAAEGISNLAVVGETPFNGALAIAIRSELPFLASAMQKALKSITVTKKEQILGDWIVLKVGSQQNYKLIFQILLPAGAVVLLILIWNYSLRKEAKRRKISEDRFRQIAETVDGLFFILSPDLSQVNYVSPNFEKWTKLSNERIYENPAIWFDFVHPDDLEMYKQDFLKVLEEKFTTNFPDFRIINGDNEVRWISLQAHQVYDEAGKITSIIGVMTDVTTRIKSRDKLNEISNQFQNAFTHASHGMALVSLVGDFLRVNDAFCSILGYQNKELLTLNVYQITHPDDLKNTGYLMQEVASGKRLTCQMEKRHIRKDGKFVSVQMNVSAVRDNNSNPVHFVAQIQDLSTLKEREEQLRHSQRMDAVGKLTGGIAHDFNNILGIILGNLEILKSTMPKEPKAELRLEKAIKGVDRGSNLIKKLLRFSRKTSHKADSININENVLNISDFIQRTFTAKIKVKTVLAENLWPVEVDAGDLEDAILNLALNSRDAMQYGGELLIETTNVILDDKYAEQNPGSTVGEHVLLSIGDTGSGIAPDVLDNILEPFFTTKPVNKGTGLGLSMVHGFVQRSKGHMKIYSEPGKGTILNIYIPKSKNIDDVTGKTLSNNKKLPKGNETILVVEDEQNLCDVAEAHLSGLGYSVYTAHNATSALDILSKEKQVDLLFSDIVMPDNQDGYEMASSALKIKPSLKILLTSGYTQNLEENNNNDEFLTELTLNMLQKPYNQHDLAVAIRRSLDA
ncbi:MAG: transporter substrate-binding domain-containing protein [Emcibacteraceae bacterium]|nr:transporter substrate-binding domain-containing protein [Emcibacteraceae bacterium]